MVLEILETAMEISTVMITLETPMVGPMEDSTTEIKTEMSMEMAI